MIYYKYDGHKGLRFFRLNNELDFPENEKVIQVCLSPGEAKKGRANCIGIYVIRKMTLLGNYGFLSQLKPCSRREFNAAKSKILKMLEEQ